MAIGLAGLLGPIVGPGTRGAVAPKRNSHLLPFFGYAAIRFASHTSVFFYIDKGSVNRCDGAAASV